MLELSPREARRLAIGAQQLAGPTPKRPTKKRLRETIYRLGALQIDTIHVVARSHHIVLWSRLGNHPKEWLSELCYPDRALFEYWAHAAAFVPVELFPYFRRMMLEYADPSGTRWNARTVQWLNENAAVLDQVISHATEFGPVSSTTFTAPEGSTRAEPWAWYGNKPTNLALELLWTMGTFMVHRREKFQRWYDLTERIMPDWDDAQLPDIDDERRALAAHAFSAMGIATARWLPDYFRKNWGNSSLRTGTVQAVVQDLVERGLIVPARVRGWGDEAYVWAELLEKRIPLSRTTLLSPFDSLVWDRRRTATMFDFELMLESYTPAPKRRYGYFSLPILYRDQLVGRLDPKADRATGQFYVRALHLEPSFVDRADERFYARLAETLRDFATFNDCDTVIVERSDPPGADLCLTAALAG
ncbi:MAG: winged helix DNA-binding domain-containing protein [Thermomicrobiales bacterium]|nr:winged helix DNA-binding domain-containing protein [Thermomicrobiales bacterium]